MIGEISDLVYTIAFILGGCLTVYFKLNHQTQKNTHDIESLTKDTDHHVEYLKAGFDSQNRVNQELRELIDKRNSETVREMKNMERKMEEQYKIMLKIDNTLSLIMEGRIVFTPPTKPHIND